MAESSPVTHRVSNAGDAANEGVPHGSTDSHPHAAWMVDLDGTLYSAPPVRLCMLGELSLAGWRALPILRRFRLEQESLRHGQSEPSDPFRVQIERTALARGVTTAEVERLVQEWMLERPAKWLWLFRQSALLDELAMFRRSGGRLALVSDYPARAKLAALRCGELFDTVVANGEAGGPRWLKPHPDGLLTAAERLGVSPSRCLVLGDRVDVDGEAARRAGMSFRHVH